ncbi:MAG: ribulokinase [Phycisphaerales bacterium]
MTAHAQHHDRVALGLDFGTESVRATLVSLDGAERGAAVSKYDRGQIVDRLPNDGPRLPPDYALQDPDDWVNSAARAIRTALDLSSLNASAIVGVGVDFTSCTMLPCTQDGDPLCSADDTLAARPHAWPKLWKHHGAKRQTDDLNRAARGRGEAWLDRYGGTLGLEWLLPKSLEIFDDDREVFEATEVIVEAGDWFVWRLVGGSASDLPRSTCQAGYKACWSPTQGYPSEEFLNATRSGFGDGLLPRLPGRHLAPGVCAGRLVDSMAERLGLPGGVPVSAAIIDAHAGVPGAGVGESDTLVMVLGTSACHMLCSSEERLVPGVAGIVRDGILPGLVGYEMGQAAVGDAFAWLARTTNRSLEELAIEAAEIPAGSNGVWAIDWLNGCRTPLMDGSLRGALQGLTLSTTPAHLYRALVEATAYGLRWIVDLLRAHEVPVRQFVATGGLPHAAPIVPAIYASVLGEPVSVHPAAHGPATGAAIFGALAAGEEQTGFRSMADAVAAMAVPAGPPIDPDRVDREKYDDGYERYRGYAESSRR